MLSAKNNKIMNEMGKKKFNVKINRLHIFVTSIFLILVLLSGLVLITGNKEKNPVSSENAVITLTSLGFRPETITIKLGESIIFKNDRDTEFWPASNLHPTHGIYSEFDPKKKIAPNETWSFAFQKPGIWKYHDHLFSNFTGTIIVLDEKGNKPVSNKNCETVSKEELIQCWDQKLDETVRLEGLDKGFKVFIALYNTEPDVPKACHGWAHVLGKAAYELYKTDKEVILRPEISYCGYGFMHGFIEQLLLETGDPKQVRGFCQYASNQLGNNGGVYSNCLHGIGHGSVDVEDEEKWGNFQAMIDPGLRKCESILTEPGELRLCYDGAFNAMQQYENKNEYELSVNYKDLFHHCRTQGEVYKVSCFFEYIGLISAATQHNFAKSADLFIAENPSEEAANYGFSKMAADFMQDDIVNKNWEKNVKDCRNIPSKYYKTCFGGILNGFMAHGLPGKEHIKGLELCKGEYLTAEEEDRCYMNFLSGKVKKRSAECNNVDPKYQKYCAQS